MPKRKRTNGQNGNNGQRPQNGNGSVVNGRNRFEDHHIIPSSRGGSSNNGNIRRVPQELHSLVHQMFINRKPEEIIELLVHDFWEDRWIYVFEALMRYRVPISQEFQTTHRMPRKISMSCQKKTEKENVKGSGVSKHLSQESVFLYSRLFANRKPPEVVEFLVYEFWNGQWYHVFEALKRYRVPVPTEFQRTTYAPKKEPAPVSEQT